VINTPNENGVADSNTAATNLDAATSRSMTVGNDTGQPTPAIQDGSDQTTNGTANLVPPKTRSLSAKDLALIALFAALTCALGVSPVIPLPAIGVTLAVQTLGMLLAGGVIGAKRAAAAMGLVIVLVAIGLPVLTGGQGGFGKLIGPTAGFIWSWPIGAAIMGALARRWWKKLTVVTAGCAAVIASVSLYPLGQTWFALTTGLPWRTAIWAWVAYLPGDIIKSVLAAIVIVTVKRAYPLMPLPTRSVTS